MSDVRAKYNGLAEKFAERSYANLEFYMQRRFNLTVMWGYRLQPGDSILELGCGDGCLGHLFVRNGFRYFGIDFSPMMIEMARRRLQMETLHGKFAVADVNEFALSEPYDAVVAYMRTFFSYVRDPRTFLQRLLPFVRKKVIVDLNPRSDLALKEAIAVLEKAGFRHVSWRPFFVPQKNRLPVWLLRCLVLCEGVPLLRSLPLRWKFHCLLKGEP